MENYRVVYKMFRLSCTLLYLCYLCRYKKMYEEHFLEGTANIVIILHQGNFFRVLKVIDDF